MDRLESSLNQSERVGMAQIRDEHRKPVIRAFVALPGETLVGVTVRSLPGSGLSVYKLNRDEQNGTAKEKLV